MTWDEFADALGAIAGKPGEAIGRDDRLVEDLGLDSVALVELVATVPAVIGALEMSAWEGVTAGELFDEHVGVKGGAGPPP